MSKKRHRQQSSAKKMPVSAPHDSTAEPFVRLQENPFPFWAWLCTDANCRANAAGHHLYLQEPGPEPKWWPDRKKPLPCMVCYKPKELYPPQGYEMQVVDAL